MNEYKFNEIGVGLEHSFQVSVNHDMLAAFLKMSGDTNPLHTNAQYAKDNGFVDKVVYGLLTSSFYSTLVGVYLPGKYCILHGLDIQFIKPVYVGDELVVIGGVSYINEAYKQLTIKALITNQNAIKVSKAVIKVGLIDE